ncbi:MAG: hydrogenase maturation peptidase HycI [Candidatus Methanomethylicaceae archaeon]
MSFEEDLLTFLKDSKKLLFIGIGNNLRKDDGAGIRIVNILKRKGIKNVLNCGPSPENYIGIIKKISPTHIIFFDAVEMGKEPGHFEIIKECDFYEQILSTHKIPMNLLFQILKNEIPNLKILFIGIQPKNIDFGKGISYPVAKGINSLVNKIIKALMVRN